MHVKGRVEKTEQVVEERSGLPPAAKAQQRGRQEDDGEDDAPRKGDKAKGRKGKRHRRRSSPPCLPFRCGPAELSG